jgi:hypothetical protein
MLYWLNFDSQNEDAFRTIFIFGNGVLAMSLFAFGNRLVFHDHDSMASFTIHFFPMVITLAFRWYILPAQAHLPEEERFCSITDEKLLSPYFWQTMFVNNIKFYICWVVPYYLINFTCLDKLINTGNYSTLYSYFYSPKGFDCGAAFDKAGQLKYVAFLWHHFLFYFFANLLGVISFYNYTFHHLVTLFYVTTVVKRGASHYIKGQYARIRNQLEKLK